MHTTFQLKKYKEMKPFGKSMNRWKDNIKMENKEALCEVVDWIHQAQVP
jgi:hypothetical protein